MPSSRAGGSASGTTNENIISSTSDAGMSNADVKCYESKFSDLDGKSAREHFLEIGSDEERWSHCGKNLTNIEA